MLYTGSYWPPGTETEDKTVDNIDYRIYFMQLLIWLMVTFLVKFAIFVFQLFFFKHIE